MRSVTVVYHREDEGWWAESPDVKGYTAADDSFAGLRKLVQEGLPFLLDVDAVHLSEQLADGATLYSSFKSWPFRGGAARESFAQPQNGSAMPAMSL